jgi:hypothetical protein
VGENKSIIELILEFVNNTSQIQNLKLGNLAANHYREMLNQVKVDASQDNRNAISGQFSKNPLKHKLIGVVNSRQINQKERLLGHNASETARANTITSRILNRPKPPTYRKLSKKRLWGVRNVY